MTAQDFDLKEFTDVDLKNLRDTIDSLGSRQNPSKVRYFPSKEFLSLRSIRLLFPGCGHGISSRFQSK